MKNSIKTYITHQKWVDIRVFDGVKCRPIVSKSIFSSESYYFYETGSTKMISMINLIYDGDKILKFLFKVEISQF